MPTARLKNGELTIPLSEEQRAELGVRDGDELEAHVLPGVISLKRKSVDVRRSAGQRILDIIEQVRLRPGQMPLTEDEIVEEVKAYRRARRSRAMHD